MVAPAPQYLFAQGLANIAIGGINAVAGPTFSQEMSRLRLQIGINDVGRARDILYNSNFQSTLEFVPRNPVGPQFEGERRNYTPLRFDASQAIRFFNQCPFPYFEGDVDRSPGFWNRLQSQLRYVGVKCDVPEVEPQGSDATAWMRLIEMSSNGAPLDSVIKDYYRSLANPDVSKRVTKQELLYNFQRSQVRRKDDKDRMLSPFWHWSPADVRRLYLMGMLDAVQYAQYLAAAGMPRDVDQNHLDLLLQFMPTPATLLDLARRRMWSNDAMDRFGLADDFADSPVAAFFCQRQGFGSPRIALEAEPDGNKNWLQLEYAASRPLPEFGTSRELLHRLRPNAAADGSSVVPGSDVWSMGDMKSCLRAQGFTDSIINRLIGIAYEPLNIRLINHIVGPYSTHPEVRAAANEAFGVGVNWIKGAMLDHGFTEAYATVAAAGVQAQADDRDNAERLEQEKGLRRERKAVAEAMYRVGLVDRTEFMRQMQDQFFTADMAAAKLRFVDQEQATEQVNRKVKALRAAWFKGSVTLRAATAELQRMQLTDGAIQMYVEEWVWERSEEQRFIATGEILRLVRDNMMTPQTALARMVNLGWNQGDAILELSMVQRDLDNAAVHAQAVANDKARREMLRQQKEALSAKAKLDKEAARQAKLSERRSFAEVADSHRRLLLHSDYYKQVHASNAAFTKAQAKNDTEKMDALIFAQMADYEKYLLGQLQLIQKERELGVISGTIDTQQAIGITTSPSFNADKGEASTPDSKSGGADSGTVATAST